MQKQFARPNRHTAISDATMQSHDCVDRRSIVPAREWFYGQYTSISVDSSRCYGQYNSLAETGHEIDVSLLASGALVEDFTRVFSAPGQKTAYTRVRGTVLNVWTGHYSKRISSPEFAQMPSGSSPNGTHRSRSYLDTRHINRHRIP